MPKSRLRDVIVKEVSFVDAGDNPEAKIDFFKAKPMKTEGGIPYPAEAFAYVPEPDKPSTWKLRLWDNPDDKETAAQIGHAVAALGAGFRGQKVEIPKADIESVKAKVLAAWRRTHTEGEPPSILIKGESMTPEEMQAALDAKDKEISDLKAKIDEMSSSEGKEEMSEGDMMKSLPEALRKKYEEMEKAAKDREAELAKMADEKLASEWMNKAKEADLAEGMGEVLKSLAKSDSEMASKVYDEMARLAKAVQEGELLKEKGKDQGEEMTFIDKVNASAKEIRKGDPKLTEHQAFAKAYEIYKGENNGN